MLTLSHRAKDALLQWKQDAPPAEQHLTLRLALSPAGWEVHPDQSRPGDVVIEHRETPVLLIQDRASDLLGKFTLDWRDGEERARLVLLAN